MTVSTLSSRVSYEGTGSTGPFAFPFRVLAKEDLLVTIRSADEVETTLAVDTDYTVSGVLSASGTVTLVDALAVGEILVIRRDPVLTQGTSIRNLGRYFAATHEDAFDRLLMQVQAVMDRAARAFAVSETYDPGALSLLVKPEAGKVLGWDSDSVLTNKTLDSSAIALPGAGRTVVTVSEFLANNALLTALDFGASGGGLVDAIVGLNAWAAAASLAADGTRATKGKLGIGSFLHSSPINFQTPRLLSIDAEGGVLKPNFDGICVDLHSDYDPANAADNIYAIHWLGGRFVNGAATKLASVGLRVFAATDFVLDGAAYFQGFLSAIDIAGQDTYLLKNFRTYQCDYGVRLLDIFGGAAAGETLACVVEDCHIGLTGTAVAGIYIVGPFSNFEVRGGSTNGVGSLASFYAESGGGGGILNPFCISIKSHHFEQGLSTSRYVWFKQTNGKSFFNVVIDNCSFAVGATGGADAVRGALRFEAVKGLSIRSCQFPITSTSGGCAIYLDANCQNIRIDRETFFNLGTILAWQANTAFVANQVVAPSTYGELVFRVTAGGGGLSGGAEPVWPTVVGGTVVDGALTWTAQCAPIIAKCPRSEITIEPSTVSLSNTSLTGYTNGKTFSGAAAGQTLNMRALLGSKFPGKLLPPKAFRLFVRAKDTQSAGATDCGVEFAVDAATYNAGGTDRRRTGIQLGGRTNSVEVPEMIEVECDANGNIYMMTTPSAAGTLTVWIVGVEALQ